ILVHRRWRTWTDDPWCRSDKILTSGFSRAGTVDGWRLEPSPPRLDIDARPRVETRLTARTPEKVASLEHRGAHPGAADQARLTVAPVDVDLAPVVVAARLPAHRLRRVLRADGVDPAGAHTIGEQSDQVDPD